MEVDTSSLQKLLEEKEQALIQLKTSYEEFKNDANEYEKELEADNEHKEKEIETLQKKLETALKKMEDYKKEINQSGKIMEREKSRLETLNEEVNNFKSRIVYLEQLNEGFESEIRNVKYEKQSIVEKLEGMEERFIIEKEDLEEQLNQKNQELERFRLDVHEYEDEIVTLRRRSNSFKKERNSTGGTESEPENNNNDEKLTHLQEEILKYRDEIETVYIQLGDKDREIKGYEMEIKRMQSEIQELNGKLEEKEKQLVEFDNIVDNNQSHQIKLQERVEEQQKNIVELNEKLTEKENKRNESLSSPEKGAYSTESAQEINSSVLGEEMSDQRFRSPDYKSQDENNVLTSPIDGQDSYHHNNQRTYAEDGQNVNVRLENLIEELSSDLRDEKRISNQLRVEIEDLKGSNTKDTDEERSSLSEKTSPIGMEEMKERSKSVEDLVQKLQEENKMMMEKYTQLLDLSTLLKEKVTEFQQEKERLERKVSDKDNKIVSLEEHFVELQEELEKLRRGQYEVESDEKELLSPSRKSVIPKLDIPIVTQGDLDTMSSDRNQLSKTPKLMLNLKNMESLKHLYIKPSIHMLPSYLTLNEERDSLGEKKQNIKIKSKDNIESYSVDSITKSLQSINVREIMNRSLESVLGKNLLFLIYGGKGTDKKQVKYKILADILGAYKGLSQKLEFREKILKLVLKIQDPIIFEKIHLGTSNPDYERLEKPIEVLIGDLKSEQRFTEYLRDLRTVDNLKTMNSLSDIDPNSQKQSVKQMVVELIVENMEEEGKVKIYSDNEPIGQQKAEIFAKTKIVLLTVNSSIESTPEVQLGVQRSLSNSLPSANKIDQILSMQEKQKNLLKFLILTINPSSSEESYKAVSDTLALLGRVEKPEIIPSTSSQIERNQVKGKENEGKRSNENQIVPNILKDRKIIHDYVSQMQTLNDSARYSQNPISQSMAVGHGSVQTSFMEKKKKKSNKFLGLFSWKKSKNDHDFDDNEIIDPSMSMMSSKSLMEPTYNIKKSVA